MNFYEYAEKILGRELTVLERRVLRVIYLCRQSNPKWEPKNNWSIPDKARYEMLSPIVNEYLQVKANA